MLKPKDEWERQIFAEFAAAAEIPVDPGSIASREPPEPDIEFSIKGERQLAELVEITDQGLAERHSRSVKTRKITGGSFTEITPLVEAFMSKSQKSYATAGARLLLLAYYDKQYPAGDTDPGQIPREVGGIAAQMVAGGAWSAVWVYDSWNRQVLWRHP